MKRKNKIERQGLERREMARERECVCVCERERERERTLHLLSCYDVGSLSGGRPSCNLILLSMPICPPLSMLVFSPSVLASIYVSVCQFSLFLDLFFCAKKSGRNVMHKTKISSFAFVACLYIETRFFG